MKRQASVLSIIGTIWFTPLSFLWQLLNQFLLSPWGLIVPLTLLITLFALQFVQETPSKIAHFYAEQLDTCTESELPQLLGALVRLGDAGIPGLVQGLASQREAVFTASRKVLQHEFDRWQESDQREHHFCVFSEAILHTCGHFTPAAQAEAMRFVSQMMQIQPVSATSPESTVARQTTIAHCGQIFSQLESMRRRRLEPQDGDFAPHADTIAAVNRRTDQPMLIASNGRPFVPTASRHDKEGEALLADTESYNPFSIARADRLQAYQRSLQSRPVKHQGNSSIVGDQESSSVAGFSPPFGFPANIEGRIAQNLAIAQAGQPPTPDISEEYGNRIQSELGVALGSDNFLTPELLNTPLDGVSHLQTTQLMQLLHHPDSSYVDSARRTLMSRDGFQATHLRLAWRLYHPISEVRQEIVELLPQTPNVQQSVWLTVLLNDPSNDVRYRTASFLATANDSVLQRLLIDRGKQDGDPRIANLADRLDKTQRETVRR